MKSIVLIEDTGLQRIKIEKVLKQHGFDDVESLPSHRLQNMSLSNLINDSHLIFIDYDNKDINFEWLMDKIRHLKSFDQLPIIVLSSSPYKSIVKEVASLGGNELLIKPYSDVKLMEKVFRIFEEPRLDDINFKESSSEFTYNLDIDTSEKTLSPLISSSNVYEPLVNTEDIESHESESRGLESHDLDSQDENSRYMPIWHKDFEIGIEEIDKEHKSLIEEYEKLYQHMKNGDGIAYFNEMLVFLQNYVDVHFAHEEEIQLKHKYPNYEHHHKRHQDFKEQLAALVNERRGRVTTNLDLIRFSLFIKNWLTYHILVEDKKIGYFLDKQVDDSLSLFNSEADQE